jgi:hypothetical protein
LPFSDQNCSLPFSLRSPDIPALLKSWKKHNIYNVHSIGKGGVPQNNSDIKGLKNKIMKYQNLPNRFLITNSFSMG